jgi:hypothetical protein
VIYTNHVRKREFEFEDIRVLSYERVKNLAILLQAATYCHNADGLPIHEVGLSFERKLHRPAAVKKIAGHPDGSLFSLLAEN